MRVSHIPAAQSSLSPLWELKPWGSYWAKHGRLSPDVMSLCCEKPLWEAYTMRSKNVATPGLNVRYNESVSDQARPEVHTCKRAWGLWRGDGEPHHQLWQDPAAHASFSKVSIHLAEISPSILAHNYPGPPYSPTGQLLLKSNSVLWSLSAPSTPTPPALNVPLPLAWHTNTCSSPPPPHPITGVGPWPLDCDCPLLLSN